MAVNTEDAMLWVATDADQVDPGTAIESHGRAIQDLSKELNSWTDYVVSVNAKLNKMELGWVDDQFDIAELKTDVQDLKDGAEVLRGRVDSLEKALAPLGSQLSQLRDEVMHLKEALRLPPTP